MNPGTEIVHEKPVGVLGEIFEAILQSDSIQHATGDTHESIALAATTAISECLGGRVVYIPIGTVSERNARNKEILAAWRTGESSVRELAAKFNIGQQRVYELLAEHQERTRGKTGRKRGSCDARNKDIYESWVSGSKNERQLALEHGLSKDYVKQIIQSTQLKLWQEKHK